MAAPLDFSSPAWLHIADWAAKRIEALRAKNDGDLDAVETARVRGQLKAFKELLGLPAEAAREAGAAPTGPFGLPPQR
jgi:hypothetical protein